MRIFNKTKNVFLAEEALVAERLFDRTKGLLGRKLLLPKEALVIRRCNSIHTFFMDFAIDVLFVDKNSQVVGIKENIAPWRFSRIYWKASFVVELSSGRIRQTRTEKGDEIALI